MTDFPLTTKGYPNWNAILAPFGFNPPSRTMWLTANHVRFLYFIERDDLVKVGISQDPKARLKALRAGSPRGLYLRSTIELPALLAFQTEKRVHAALKDYAVGREWFRMRAREARAVAKPFCDQQKAAAARLEECGYWRWPDEFFEDAA